MACAVGTFDDVTPLGRSAFRWRRSRGFICGVVGAGFLTSTWLIATFATMHSIAAPYSPSDRLAEVATAPKVAPSPRHERLIHVGKADRLAAFDAKPAVPLTASLIQSHAEKTAAAATALAALTKNNRLTMAAEQPVVAAISDSVKFRKDDVIAPQVELASAETDEDDGDRIIVP
ncbi:hypothetical protein ACCT09_35770, partial [Rhizobium ruizarguesonis]